MLIVESAHACGKDSSAAEVANHLALVGAIDHGKPSDIEAQQLGGGFGDEFVGIGNHEVSAASVLNRGIAGGLFVEGAKDIAARDDSGELPAIVENQQSLMPGQRGIVTRDAFCNFSHPGASGDYG